MTTTDAHDAHLSGINDEFADSAAPHACDRPDCPLEGVTLADIRHIALATQAWTEHHDRIRLLTFRDDTGLQLLLGIDWDGRYAVVGALYTPGLVADLRSRPYTVRPWDDESAN